MCPTFNGLAFTRSRSREIACGQHGWNLWARVEGQKNQSQVLTSADGGVPNPGEPVRRSLAGQPATERVYTRGGRPIKLMGGA